MNGEFTNNLVSKPVSPFPDSEPFEIETTELRFLKNANKINRKPTKNVNTPQQTQDRASLCFNSNHCCEAGTNCHQSFCQPF